VTLSLAIAAIALAIWLYLVVAHGRFWEVAIHSADDAPLPAAWPTVVAVVPARDEAGVIGTSLPRLLRQNYPGPFSVILVDDQSRDGTGTVATQAVRAIGMEGRLTVLSGTALPAGWTGKVFAMQQGATHANTLADPPRYLLFTDADIAYGPGALRELVAQSEADRLVLNSRMVKLRCESFAERALIPAFVFFFQMLYPFAWVNRPQRATAAAAGGCMLVRRDALQAAGGLAAIGSALIDDCALARALKAQGPIWLGLTGTIHSLRPYPRLVDIRRMVARSAYDQLGYSPLLLAATIVGMAVVYAAPPLLAVFASGLAWLPGLVAWMLMAAAFQPILRFYRLSPLWGLALPAIAAAYMAFTLDSAYQHARGKGGLWKGRVQAKES
jgi:hopene-associated glycosyltransferase HpnB